MRLSESSPDTSYCRPSIMITRYEAQLSLLFASSLLLSTMS